MIQTTPAVPLWANPFVANAVVGLIVAVTGWILKKGQEQNTKKLDEVHTLVNNNMGQQLKQNLLSAQALYTETGKPAHKQLLDDAKLALDSHNSNQATVDAKQAP